MKVGKGARGGEEREWGRGKGTRRGRWRKGRDKKT